MAKWLAILVMLAAVLALMPWRRESPRHRFILEQLSRLQDNAPDESAPADLEELNRDLDLGARVHHGISSTHV